MKRIAMVYGYGQLANGELDEQTKGRCRKALELRKARKVDEVCITVGVRQYDQLMAVKMKEWMTRHGNISALEVTIAAKALNTAAETEICHRLVRKTDKVVAVSSWYHLPRIWLLWLWRGRIVKLAGSTEGIHWKDIWIEPLKLANSALRPFSSARFVK